MEKIIMKNTINTNENKFNGNCKGVRDITNDIHYGSLTVAAMVKGVKISSISYAAKHGTPCKGSYFVLESELYKSGDKLCAENAKANRRAEKATARAVEAETKNAELEAEMAEFRQWKAEQEAKRKAEEERLERERKEEEKRQKLIAKAQEKVERWEKKLSSHNALGKDLEQKLMQAIAELDNLLYNGKEVA